MLLIDATNLNIGGGGVLLQYLLDSLSDRPFRALVSANTNIGPSSKIIVTNPCSPLGKTRQSLLENAIRDSRPTTVCCFGNVPPRRRLSVPRTITYFQNAHLVAGLDRHCRYSFRDRLRYFLLRRSIRKWRDHTDIWVFQTAFIGDSFQEEYGRIADSRVLPFFDDDHLRQTCASIDQGRSRQGFVYLSDDRPHKNHARLLDAWAILKHKFDLVPELHLTIPPENRHLLQRINDLKATGLMIENHGIMPRDAALNLTASCEFVVFPSLLETLGLGVVEGCLLGCKVLVSSDRAFDDVVIPSGTFDPLSPESIASSVVSAIRNTLPNPTVVLKNRIDELKSLLFSTA